MKLPSILRWGLYRKSDWDWLDEIERDPNIHKHVAAICEQLGLVPRNVMALLITPREVEATVYLLNEAGNKYTTALGEPATETRRFRVVA